MDTNSREAKIRAFFNKRTAFHTYLEKRFGVELRAYITRELLGEVTRSTILDIGCGDGTISLQFAMQDNLLTLIDLSGKMLEAAIQNTPNDLVPNYKYLNLDFFDYVPNQLFDIVLCVGVLAHLESPDIAIKKISSFLKPGGRCILQFTDQDSWIAKIYSFYYSMYTAICGNPYQYSLQNFSSPVVFRSLLESGLKVVNQCRYSFLLPGMGRLPDKFLFRYQLFTLETPWLSQFGSEVILLLDKS